MRIVREWFQRQFADQQVVVLVVILISGFLSVLFLGSLLLPVVASLVIAYLLDSVVAFLEKRRFPRLPAVLLVYTGFIAVLVTTVLVLVPLVVNEIAAATREIPQYQANLQSWVEQLPQQHPWIGDTAILSDFLDELFTPKTSSQEAETEFTEWVRAHHEAITSASTPTPNPNGTRWQDVLAFSVSSLQSLIRAIVYLVLMPTLVFFMLKDKKRIQTWFKSFLPRERGLTVAVWRDVDRQIGNYVRGKVWEIFIVGSVTYLTFSMFQLKFGLLLAVLVGLSVIVPYVGATVVTFPVAMVAWAQWGFEADFLWVMSLYAIIQALDGNVLVPLLFSEVVSLHPIAIICAILVFGGFWGAWGVFFAIPLATLIQAVLKAWPRSPVLRGPASG